jgi:O-antigen/teichoic acid export membrane protein
MSDNLLSKSSVGPRDGHTGLTATAASGTGFTSTQALLNKIATMVSMWVIALRLTPDEFGMAALTLAVGVFLVFLPPLTVGDVLVTHRRRFLLVSRIASRLAMQVGVATTVFIIIAAPLVAWIYDKYPAGVLVGLLFVVAFRPWGDGLCTLPLSKLRLDFRYRSIAFIDGSIQFIATIVTVSLAFMGFGALALVLPQIIAVFCKAAFYRSSARSSCETDSTKHSYVTTPWIATRAQRQIRRDFFFAATAQYVHNILVLLPVLILGYFSTEEQTGLYAFAFTLSAQANGLIASQLGMVLQPIFGRLSNEVERQIAAFLRVIRTIGSLAVPLTLLQAALAAPLFGLIFESKWDAAIQLFSVLSIMEGFYFATAPTMSLLRAQRRFKTYFVWQASQFVLSVVAYSMAASHYGAIGVAVCAAVLWGIGLPIAVSLCIRGVKVNRWTAVKVFLAPWCTAAPIAFLAWIAWYFLQPYGTTGKLIALFGVGPIAFVCALLATRFSQPSVYADLQPIVIRVLHRIAPTRFAK